MRLLAILLLFIFSQSLFAQTSYVPMGKILRRGGYEIMGTARMWSSVSRYDDDGKEVKFGSGESFGYIEGEFLGRYGATQDLQFTGGVNFRQNQAKFDDGQGEIVDATATGLQAAFGGFHYAFKPVERMQYTLEGTFRYTPYSNSDYDANDLQDIVLGDDGSDYSAGLSMTYTTQKKNYLGARFLWRSPGNDLSNEINYQIEGALTWNYIALVGGLSGVYSMNNDPYTDDPSEKPARNTGGTALYNSVNRQYMSPYAGINFALGKTWRIELRGAMVTSARSTDTGQLYTVSLAKRQEDPETKFVENKFKQYDLEANVTKVSPKKEYVIIDKGLAADVEKGMRFDLYHFDYLGGNTILARAVVIQVNADQAVLRLTSRFTTKFEIKEGCLARASR